MFSGVVPTVEAPRRDIRSKRSIDAITPATPSSTKFQSRTQPPSKRTKLNSQDPQVFPHQPPPDSASSGPQVNAFDDYMHTNNSNDPYTTYTRQKPGIRRTYDEITRGDDSMDVETTGYMSDVNTNNYTGISQQQQNRSGPFITSLSPQPSPEDDILNHHDATRNETGSHLSKRAKTNTIITSTLYPSFDIQSMDQAHEMIAELLHQRQMREKQMRDRNRLVQELHDQLTNIQQVNAQMRQFYMGTVESLHQERQKSSEKDIIIRQLQQERDQCHAQLQQWAQTIRNYPPYMYH